MGARVRLTVLSAVLLSVGSAYAAPSSGAAVSLPPSDQYGVPIDQTGVADSECPGGLQPHDKISIASDTDFTAANGVTGGSGSASDPYIISCWSIGIDATVTQTGISVKSPTKYFKIVDVQVVPTNAPCTGCLRATGISVSSGGKDADGNAVGEAWVDHTTVSAMATGIMPTSSSPPADGSANVHVLNNRLSDNGTGVSNAGAGVEVVHNYGSGGSTCFRTSVATVTANTCTGSGTGFAMNGATATLNLAEANRSYGFDLESVGTFTDNYIDRNNFGIILASAGFGIFGPTVGPGNIIVSNGVAGIDMEGNGATIKGNTIEYNGAEGIITNPSLSETSAGAGGSRSNIITGNTIGGNPWGIVLEFTATLDTIDNTTWSDGHPSIIRFTDQNTFVDAGSDQRGIACPAATDDAAPTCPGSDIHPVLFHDYVATAADAAGITLTSATFDFGDTCGAVHCTYAIPINDLTGHSTPPDVKHFYKAPGTYTATLDVHVNNQGADQELSDTTRVTVLDATTPSGGLLAAPVGESPWPRLGNDPQRTFYPRNETKITKDSVTQLVEKWRFPTSEPVTASPAVATVNVGGILKKVVYDGDFAGTVYAIDAATGLPFWTKCAFNTTGIPPPSCNPAIPGNPDMSTDYGVIVASPTVADVATTLGTTESRVFVAGNSWLTALDAATGGVRWSYNFGPSDPTYDIESSPIVVDDPNRPGKQMVIFGIDCNQHCPKGGGVYAVDATDGHLLWFFDPLSGQAYHPSSDTFGFDPTNVAPTADDLKDDPHATCGGVWSSPAVDPSAGLLYLDTSNCTFNDSNFLEAVFALKISDGTPAWHYVPRPIDAADMDFGATPTVFKLGDEEVVGVGGKDGVYYLFDAHGPGGTDPENTPIWSTKLSLGGSLGGFFNSVTDGKQIYLSSALGEDSQAAFTNHEDALKYREVALDVRTGNVVSRQLQGPPNFGQNSLSPGIYWTGGLDHLIHAWNAADLNNGGQGPLWTFPLGGAVSSAPAIVDGELFIGTGTGATYRSEFVCNADPLDLTCGSLELPHPIPLYEFGQGIYGFCLGSDPQCIVDRAAINAGKHVTKLVYDGDTTGDHNDPVTLSATLTDTSDDSGVSGKTVTFSLESETCNGTTDAKGHASCTVTPTESKGTYPVSASFAGDADYTNSNDQKEFTLTKEETTLSYTGDTTVPHGADLSVSAVLKEDGQTPIGGRGITLTLGAGGQGCSDTTNQQGKAACTISSVSSAPGSVSLDAAFAGDGGFKAASDTATITVTPGSGTGPGGKACPGFANSPLHQLVGTAGDNVLIGTKGTDVICGLRGNDVIKGLGGNDILIGGTGRDILIGGAGDDRLRGSAGNDVLRGGAGNDRLSGWKGNDRERGGGGNDRLKGGPGKDRLFGGGGGDVLLGGQRSDYLVTKDGIPGNDFADGQAGRNRCSADPRDQVVNCLLL